MDSAAHRDLNPGDMVGDYKVEEMLGKGGFGSVFKAIHPLIGKQVAIKVLKPELSANPEMVSRFVAEARAVNQIRHRHIIDIFTFGRLPDGRQYYVMELLRGATLDRYLREVGPLPLTDAVPILQGIARALDAAHAAGIAHRDLKPENIFIADDDGEPFPKLLDFGLAKLLTGFSGGHKTESGVPMGTPSYMSPEQCRGRAVDHRTDFYALGVVAYQLVTGKLPITGTDFMEIVLKQISERPPPPSTHRELPAGVDEAILRMLEKEPAARPMTAVGAIEGLEQAARAAGLSISSRQVRSHRVLATSGQDHLIASAETPVVGDLLGQAKIPSHVAAEATPSVNKGPRRSALVYGVLGTLVAVAVAGIVVLRNRDARGPDEPPPAPAAAAPVRAAAPPPPAAAPPPAPAPAPPPAPATVKISFRGTEGARIVAPDGRLLGEVPTTLELPRGDQPLELRFESKRHVAEKRAVDVSRDAEIPVELRPKKRQGGASPGEGDIPPF